MSGRGVPQVNERHQWGVSQKPDEGTSTGMSLESFSRYVTPEITLSQQGSLSLDAGLSPLDDVRLQDTFTAVAEGTLFAYASPKAFPPDNAVLTVTYDYIPYIPTSEP